MARKMKDSGIEWIGEIPEEWEIVPVRSCFDEVRTKNTDGQEQNALQFKSGNIISKTNFNASMDDYVADTITNYTVVLPDTVMINGLNLNYDFKSLRVALVKEKGVITSAYLAIFPDRKKISPQYATYLFKGYETKMAFHNMGAGIRKTLGYKEFKNQPLLLPSEKEQNKISAYLDSKCSHIDIMLSKIRSSIEEYKKLKQTVITQAVTKGIRGEREMKDSGVEWIGEIPKEWVIQKIKSISSRINVGVVIRPSEYFDENGTVPFLRGINVKEYLISSDNMVYINESSNRILSKSQVHTDDILIVRDGSIGTSCVVPAEFDGANVVSMVIATPSISCDSRFICYSLNSDVGKTQFTLTKIGSALTHTSISAVSDIIVAVPSCAEQKEIADYLDAKCVEIDGLIAKKEQLVKELESYKKSLIYEVVTGKREV
ncbi:restriction endonuclease subunit S [Faecalibacterium sp.]|uniref:restriction endonuclease subunit S n=1 Tax=Faecalibacterium sp. TaxID=1971605 RepID=UPI0040254F00